jgi:hypothetical protein
MIRTTRMMIFTLICLTLESFAINHSANAVQLHSIAVDKHGTLILSVPSNWKEGRLTSEEKFPTITFSPAKGDEFKVHITILWSPTEDPTFNEPERVRRLIDDDLRGMLPQAVEEKVNIQEFKGFYGLGYYFFLTDMAPKPGEYPYAVRAGIGVGDLLLSVTVLTRSKNSEGITSTIKALQGASQIYK